MTCVPSSVTVAAGIVVAAVGLVLASQASAGDLPKYGANCEVMAQTVGQTGDWLGHFTGGRFVRAPAGYSQVDWRDQYACFPTRLECSRWQAAERHVYGQIEGYKTCLPLR